MTKLTIFYDGCCPLCVAEVKELAALDSNGNLAFDNLQDPTFAERWPGVDTEDANRIIMGVLANGNVIRGLDLTHHAWSFVGKGYRTAWLRWPIIKPIADMGYRLFAKHRYKISAWITGQPRCEACSIQPIRSKSKNP